MIVTERVVSGAGMSGIAGTAELGGVGGIGSSGLVSTTMGAAGTGLNMGGTATIGHMRSSSDHHFSQTVGSASPSMARSRITKYNTVQYSK